LILSSNADIEQTKQEVASLFGDGVIIKNRFQLNDALYKMLNTENLAVYLIFTLILIIALFNVIGSIIMMILDKQKNIATLYNLGATLTEIKRIFFYQGSLMSVLGGVIGIVLGFALVAFQLYGPESLKIMITPSLAYPVTIKPINFLVVFATISVLGIIASKLASSRINSKLIK
jgi:lipoprotein-releasing system permease protein